MYAIAGLLSRNKSKDESKRFVLVLVDIAALAAQATSFVLWPLLDSKRSLWLIPVALILVSCGWWENYVSMQSRIGKFFMYNFLLAFSYTIQEIFIPRQLHYNLIKLIIKIFNSSNDIIN